MLINNNCDDGICKSFKIKVNSDGSFEPLGISEANFNALFPNFGVRVDAEGKLTIDNFYNDNASINKQNPTQIVTGNKILADGVLTVVPSSATQITSWQYRANGVVGTNVSNLEDIENEDYPTLAEVLNSVSLAERDNIVRITTPSYQAYVEQVIEVLDNMLLPNIQKITIELSSGEIESGAVLNSAGETITKAVGLTTVVVVPDIEYNINEPIFRIEAGVAELKLYPRFFKGLAKENVCSYVQSLIDMAKVATDSKILVTLYDYHVPQSFNTGVVAEDEPKENLLTTLLKLESCDVDFGENYKLTTPYGRYDSETGAWEYITPFHYNNGTQRELAGTHRFDYELGCIATVSNIVGGMTWNGHTNTDAVSHNVMSVLHRGVGNVIVSGLHMPSGVIMDAETLSMNVTSTGSARMQMRDFLKFDNGSRDIEIIYENDSGDTTALDFVIIDGISENAGESYFLSLNKLKRYEFTNIRVQFGEIEYIVGMSAEHIHLFDYQGSHPSKIYKALELIEVGSQTVSYAYHQNESSITVASDAYIVNSAYSYEVDALPLFPTHETAYSSLQDGIFTIKLSIDGFDYITPVLMGQVVVAVDLAQISHNFIIDIINSNSFDVSWRLTTGQVVQHIDTFLTLVYGYGLRVDLVDGDIDALLQAHMSKNPMSYYSYLVGDDEILMSPLGTVFIEDTPPHKIGVAYRSILTFIKDNITKGYTSFLEPFLENGIDIVESEIFINANIVRVETGTIPHDGHLDTLFTATVSDIFFSSEQQDSAPEPIHTVCSTTRLNIDTAFGASTTKLGIVDAGWARDLRLCEVVGFTVTEERSEDVAQIDTENNYVHYTFTDNGDGSVIVNYTAYDKDGNDITDQFNTLTLGDYFLHKEVE